jgi:hypothetical protein
VLIFDAPVGSEFTKVAIVGVRRTMNDALFSSNDVVDWLVGWRQKEVEQMKKGFSGIPCSVNVVNHWPFASVHVSGRQLHGHWGL